MIRESRHPWGRLTLSGKPLLNLQQKHGNDLRFHGTSWFILHHVSLWFMQYHHTALRPERQWKHWCTVDPSFVSLRSTRIHRHSATTFAFLAQLGDTDTLDQGQSKPCYRMINRDQTGWKTSRVSWLMNGGASWHCKKEHCSWCIRDMSPTQNGGLSTMMVV